MKELTARTRNFFQKCSKMGMFFGKSGHGHKIFACASCTILLKNPPSINPASAAATVLDFVGIFLHDATRQIRYVRYTVCI